MIQSNQSIVRLIDSVNSLKIIFKQFYKLNLMTCSKLMDELLNSSFNNDCFLATHVKFDFFLRPTIGTVCFNPLEPVLLTGESGRPIQCDLYNNVSVRKYNYLWPNCPEWLPDYEPTSCRIGPT